MRRWIGLLVTVGVGAALLAACDVGPSYDFVVDRGTDEADAVPGDGVCAVAGATPGCTLRAAVDEANALHASAVGPAPVVTARLAADVTIATAGAGEDANGTGDLDITGGLTVVGDGHVVDASRLDRAFDLHRGGLYLDHLTVTGGRSDDSGGGVRAAPDTTLTAVRTTFTDNRSVTRSSCLRRYGSDTPNCSPSVVGGGGAIASHGRTTIVASTFEQNVADVPFVAPCEPVSFGGLEACAATLGGAVLAFGPLVVGLSTFDRNLSGGPHIDFAGGAAIYATASAEITFSTLTDNGSGAPVAVVGATVRTSIVVSTSCAAPVLGTGHNLRSPEPCGAPGPSGLGPLAGNGGVTETRVPDASSPAVDAIAPADCLSFTADQRGLPRGGAVACDIGAVERQPSDA